MASQTHNHQHEPMYGWALDLHNRPIAIATAKSGAGYTCPVCGQPMIARKGSIKQHHFAHVNLLYCSPENVAQAVGIDWLILELGRRMVLGQPCQVSWNINGQQHTENLLEGVVAIVQNLKTEYGMVPIALKTSDERLRSVIFFDMKAKPDDALISNFIMHGIPCLVVPPNLFRSGQMTLEQLIAASELRGGWLLAQSEVTAQSTLISAPEQLRQLLHGTVNRPPYRFWSPLTQHNGYQDVLDLGQYRLWLPREIWDSTIGGSRNRLSVNLSITSQEDVQDDGSTIVLYYVSLHRHDHAVAVRRFAKDEPVRAMVSSEFRRWKSTAEDVARLLATC